MAKRFYKSMKMKESYAGREQSKRMMARDGAMISADMSAPALLPQGVIDKYWPRINDYSLGYVPNDLFQGVQRQRSEDNSDLRKAAKPNKY